MSPLATMMLRFGWVRLSDYGLKVSASGQLVPTELLSGGSFDSSWDAPTTSSPIVTASRQVPAMPVPVYLRPAPPPVPAMVRPTQVSAATVAPSQSQDDEEEWAWQAAVAKAKAAAEDETGSKSADAQVPAEGVLNDEEAGFADTTPLPKSVIVKPVPAAPVAVEAQTEVQTEVAAEVQTEVAVEALTEVAVEALTEVAIEAITEVAIEAIPCVALEPTTAVPCDEGETNEAGNWERLVDAARSRSADFHTETDAFSYEDTRVELQAIRPSAEGSSNSIAKSEAEIDPTQLQEQARKLRAMREIQRLQGRAPLGDFKPIRVGAPPHRRRLAAGTSPTPTALSQARPRATPQPRPVESRPPLARLSSTSKVDLPRVTQRLHRQ